MNELKTPNEWTVKSRIFSKETKTDSIYNFDSVTYSNVPTILNLCWQPTEAASAIEERGRVVNTAYQAVVYDDKPISEGDLVQIDALGWFEVQSIRRYLSHRLVTVRSTDRRCGNA